MPGEASTAADSMSVAAAALERLSRLSMIALTVTISMESDIETAAIGIATEL